VRVDLTTGLRINPLPNHNLGAPGAIRFSGTAAPHTHVHAIKLKVFSGEQVAGTAVAEDPAPRSTATVHGRASRSQASRAADTTVVVTQFDQAGNAMSVQFTFVVDAVSRSSRWACPRRPSDRQSAAFRRCRWSAAGDGPNVLVKIWQGSTPAGSPYRTFSPAVSGVVRGRACRTPSCRTTPTTATVEQSDSALNTTTTPVVVFRVDTIAPAVRITSPIAAKAADRAGDRQRTSATHPATRRPWT